MEDNNTNMPVNCANGCGFYGNPMNNNMCSKCFKEQSQKNAASEQATSSSLLEKSTQPETPLAPSSTPLTQQLTAVTSTTPTQAPHSPALSVAPPSSTQTQTKATGMSTSTLTPPPSTETGASTPTSDASDTPESPTPGVQANKGRCFMCRAKIPLAKQAINKCRCDFVFCDAHKATTKHDCQFDFAKMGKDILTKNNPKLNDKPRGGRSFTRIQE